MEIIIDDNYCIFSNDRHTYHLSKYSGRDEDGNLMRSSSTYHKSFESLFKNYYHRKLRTAEGIESFKDILTKQQEIFKTIKRVAEELELEVEVT
jgi:hypothetical protein